MYGRTCTCAHVYAYAYMCTGCSAHPSPTGAPARHGSILPPAQACLAHQVHPTAWLKRGTSCHDPETHPLLESPPPPNPPPPQPTTRRTHSTHSQPPLPFHAGAGKQQPPSMHVRTGQGRHLLNLSPIDANARTPAHDLGGINKVLERRVVHRGEGAREGALLLLRAVLAALCPCRSYVTTPRHATRRRSVGSAVAARHPHAGKPGARQRMPAETSQGGG